MKKKTLLFLFFLYVFHSNVKAQWSHISGTIPTPNAASLGTYGETGVSMFGGAANISVPLYSLSGNKISLPIGLSYNATGLRPDLHPGWVGNGWHLLCGGAITRKANGLIDEYNKTNGNGGSGQYGYYYRYGALNSSDWASNAVLGNISAYSSFPGNTSGLLGAFDTEPDEFNFNFLGFSGKFFLDQNGAWQVQSDQNLKIIFNPADIRKPLLTTVSPPNLSINQLFITAQFMKFTIIDDHGNQYIFGNSSNDYAVEYSDVLNPAHSGEGLTATSWYLTKIISADAKETIDLTYERGPFQCFLGFVNSITTSNSASGGSLAPGCINNIPSTLTSLDGRVTSPVYLTKISLPSKGITLNFLRSPSNELNYSEAQYIAAANYDFPPSSPSLPAAWPEWCNSVAFIPYFNNPQNIPSGALYKRFMWFKLDEIDVVAGDIPVKSIKFNYTNNSSERLNLGSVDDNYKITYDGTSFTYNKESYSFTYNPNKLPAYATTFCDDWGFNNNKTITAAILNNFPAYQSSEQAIQPLTAVDPVALQSEILTKVQYPTGGYSLFEYEPNSFNASVDRRNTANGITLVNGNGTAGGLRIKKITTYDPFNAVSSTKEYYYVKNYSISIPSNVSSGILDSKVYHYSSQSGVNLNGTSVTMSTCSFAPVIPLTSTSMGQFIGYSEVVEKKDDGSYSIFYFSNHDNGYPDEPRVNSFGLFTPFGVNWNSKDFERGRLIKQRDYDNLGNKVQEIENTYTRMDQNTKSARSVEKMQIQFCLSSAGSISFTRMAKLLYYYPFLLTNSKTTLYQIVGTAMLNESQMLFDGNRNLIEHQQLQSDGKVKFVRYKYPSDFVTTNTSNPYNIMVSSNQIALPIEKREILKIGNTEYLTGAELNRFSNYGSVAIYNDTVFRINLNSPILASSVASTSLNASLTFSDFVKSPLYTFGKAIFYDPNGNVSSVFNDQIYNESFIRDKAYRGYITGVSINGKNRFANGTQNMPLNYDIGYSSFEYSQSDMSYGTGNIAMDYSKIQTRYPRCVTGNKCYNLSSASITMNGIDQSKKYIVTYWSDHGACNIPGMNPGVPGRSTTVGTVTWTLYTHTQSAPFLTQIAVMGTNDVRIDELRIYPQYAYMKTYTYDIFGNIESIDDENGRITRYEYDMFNRLSAIKDQDGNILKSMKSTIQGAQ